MNYYLKPEDICDWSKLIAHCDAYEDELNEQGRSAAKSALAYLRKILGEDFLSYAQDRGNPLMSYFVNQASWTRKWLVWFADALREAEQYGNSARLHKRLKDPLRAIEALSVLETAVRFGPSGFGIVFDTPISFEDNDREPDLKLTTPDDETEVFIEVSWLKMGKKSKRASVTSQQLVEAATPPGVTSSGLIHKALAGRHLQDCANRVRLETVRARDRGTLGEITIAGVLDIAMAPKLCVDDLRTWAHKRGLAAGEFAGPTSDDNQLQRLANKIDTKRRQLPRDKPRSSGHLSRWLSLAFDF